MSEIRAIDIPAKHVLELDRDYFEASFTCIDENGAKVSPQESPYMIVRNRDGKVFKLASYVPYGWKARDYVYLEEL